QDHHGRDGQPPHADRPGAPPAGGGGVLQRAAEDPVQPGGNSGTLLAGQGRADGQRRVNPELGQQPGRGAEPVHGGPGAALAAGGRQQGAGPAGDERGDQGRGGQQLRPHRQLGEPHGGDQPEAKGDSVQ